MPNYNELITLRDVMEDKQEIIENQPMRMGTTLKFNTEKTGFLIAGFSEGIEPLQQIREVQQNAIDSIRRSGRTDGIIEWGPHPDLPQFISCLDNGEGMNGRDIQKTLTAGLSGGVQSKKDNFGVGLQLGVIMQNPNGVRFDTWQKNVGTTFTIWVTIDENGDPVAGLQLHDIDGEEHEILALAEKCPFPDGNGTRVTLMGDHENTIEPPEDLPGGQRWVLRALNRRYYNAPSEIVTRVKFPDGYSDSVRHRGTGYYLNDPGITESNGIVQYEQFRINWWILKPKNRYHLSEERQTSQMWNRKGHISFLYQDELYGMIDAKLEASEELRKFGCNDRCVIYIELDDKTNSRADFKRQTVLLNDREIDLKKIQSYFYKNLPQEIRDLVNPANTMTMDDKNYFSDFADKLFRNLKEQRSTIAKENGTQGHDAENEEETEVGRAKRRGTSHDPPRPTTTTGKGNNGTRQAPVAPLNQDLEETKIKGVEHDKNFKYDVIWEGSDFELLPHFAGMFSRPTRKLHIATDWEPGKKMRAELLDRHRNVFEKIWSDEVENRIRSLIDREYAMLAWEKILMHEAYRINHKLKTDWAESAYSPTSVTALFQPTQGARLSIMTRISKLSYYGKLRGQLTAAKNAVSEVKTPIHSNN
jgi:hypothetical protein